MNLTKFTDEFAELDAQLLQASAQAEATLINLLSIDSKLAQAKRATRPADSDDPASQVTVDPTR
ncbi:MAG TPA: hypothetical protein VFC00_06540 [Micromonosporaceae bacterium]|nr:hypothetical protein [Micromonosporaceae bacterium]